MMIEGSGLSVSLENTLERLFRPEDKFCFLAGSGISVDPPSYLPTGSQFTRILLEQLVPQEESPEILELMNLQRPTMRNSSDYLRFEQLLGYLEKFDPQLQILNRYATCKTPNFSHLFLAQMLVQGHTVLTTNFDNLIEYALLKMGVSRKRICPVINQKTWEMEFKRKQYPIYKTHGSLIDFRTNQADLGSLKSILTLIKRNRGEMFQLESWKRKVLLPFLQDHDLIILGYSGLNDFDVIPTLWNISSSKRVLWVNHDPKIAFDEAEIKLFEGRESSRTTGMRSYEDRVNQILLAFSRYQTRQASDLVHITVDTGQFLDWLWRRYISSPPKESNTKLSPETEWLLSEHLGLSEANKWLLAGQIFDDRYISNRALQAYQTALRFAKDSGDQKEQGACLNNLAWFFYTQNRLEEALTYYREAFIIADQLNNQRGKVSLLKNIGWLLHKQGHFEEAFMHYQQSLDIVLKLPDSWEQAAIYTNMAWLFFDQQKLKETFEYFQRALNIYERLDDLQGKATILNSIGRLFHTQERFQQAIEYYQQSLDITEQLGDLRGKTSRLNNIGKLFENQGRPDLALTYYRKALAIADQLEDFQGRATTLTNIGLLLHNQESVDDALEFCQQALSIYDQQGDLRGKASCLNTIGWLLHKQKRRDIALDYYQQGLNITEKQGFLSEKVRILNNMGELLRDLNRREEALKTFQQALIIADQLKNLDLVKEIQEKLALMKRKF
ncbi:MAG: tetratricopeptide repeat protein [Candidatus Hermodarchaeota archaeon]